VTGFAAAVALLALLPKAQTAPQAAADSLPPTIEFNRDIRPILSDKCYTCHGPDASRRMRNLRFDLEESARQDLGSGRFAIVPGDPGNSQMIQRITASDPARKMPPVSSGRTLTEREIATLRRWVEQGAKWEKHWSFIPPKRPDVPKVRDQARVRNPIDSFVLERLEKEGLRFSPEADRATLIRRVSLDLTGLPPTPAEVAAFLADRSPNAYEKVVDRLLQSPRYGERMAAVWMDAARYADSNGYQTDLERRMWRWRDWVIDAFNRNMRFDQFTIEQLAGDLLPNPTPDQRLATAFNRNHRANTEGGIIPEEFAVEYVVDRVDTTATVFLGLTLGCARCHDHKYDPFTQKEFYQLFSFFNNVPENGRARRYGNSPPVMKAPTQEQQAQLKRLDDEVAAANENFARLEPELARAQRAWESSLDKSRPLDGGPFYGLTAHWALDGDLGGRFSGSKNGKVGAPRFEPEARFVAGRIGQAASLDGQRFIETGDAGTFRTYAYLYEHPLAAQRFDDAFTAAAWVNPASATGAILSKTLENPDRIPESRGYGLSLKDGKVRFFWATDTDEALRLETESRVNLNAWSHVAATYDGTRAAEGVKIYVDGREEKLKVLFDDLNDQPILGRARPVQREGDPFRIGAGEDPKERFRGSIDDVRLYERALSRQEIAMLADATPIAEIAALAWDRRTPAQAAKIRDYFLEHSAPGAIRQASQQALDARVRREQYYEDIQTAMVMEELPAPRESHVLIRGVYDRPGEKVDPGVPSILPPMPANYPKNRLGLARWLVDPSHPLTARVTVNRFWQMYFGAGLVKTAENFGSQGEAPSHPALLDWLATEFIRTGWDVKAVLRTIVTSATYRQSSKPSPNLLERDPDNRLLARGPSSRLPAEIIRDQALYLAGLLVDKTGGPSVKPYQPDGLWREINAGEEYVQEHGENLYRRSLYTFMKRTVPPPSMANFDASNRESCLVLRTVTNTPLQALDLMNNVAFLEAARVFGQRMMREGGATPRERIAFAFRLATARAPTAAETDILMNSFSYQLDNFLSKPGSALKYLSQGEYPRDPRLDANELAAYSTVASLILNLNKTITKD
jgi:hypothetical protein